jgi:hypothetical protein
MFPAVASPRQCYRRASYPRLIRYHCGGVGRCGEIVCVSEDVSRGHQGSGISL